MLRENQGPLPAWLLPESFVVLCRETEGGLGSLAAEVYVGIRGAFGVHVRSLEVVARVIDEVGADDDPDSVELEAQERGGGLDSSAGHCENEELTSAVP